jgi:hypothetical protein
VYDLKYTADAHDLRSPAPASRPKPRKSNAAPAQTRVAAASQPRVTLEPKTVERKGLPPILSNLQGVGTRNSPVLVDSDDEGDVVQKSPVKMRRELTGML